MKEVTMYIANDGKKFDDYDECFDYEVSMESLELYGQVAMFGLNGKQLCLEEDGILFSYHRCEYIRFLNENAYEAFLGLIDKEGYGFFDSRGNNIDTIIPGHIYHNPDNTGWYDLTNHIESFSNLAETMMECGY